MILIDNMLVPYSSIVVFDKGVMEVELGATAPSQ